MNLRILKKLSKRAAPLLVALGHGQEQFPAAKDENYHGMLIRDRKHWERISCHPKYEAIAGRDEILFKTQKGKLIVMRPPDHPLKGTIMVGGMSGYYEPEWDEECAWKALSDTVFWTFTDYDEEADDLKPTRELRTPAAILQAAREMIAESRRQSGR
jgi:hypothetical protein